MRRVAVFWLLVAMAASGGEEAGGGKRILTTLYPVHIATLNVVAGVPGVRVTCLAPPAGGCLHDYQLAPGDMVALGSSDILVRNGVGAEPFLDGIHRRFPKLKVIDAGKGIQPLRSADGDNPHVWLSVSLHMGQVDRIAAGLAEFDPEHAEAYRRNAAAYVRRLELLRQRMGDGLKGVASREIVTFHDAFPYFAREFGFVVAGVVERHPGAEPAPRELKEAIDTVRRCKVRAVFAEPQYPVTSARVIAAETGARMVLLDPVVSGDGGTNGYVAAMDRNLDVLREALAPAGTARAVDP